MTRSRIDRFRVQRSPRAAPPGITMSFSEQILAFIFAGGGGFLLIIYLLARFDLGPKLACRRGQARRRQRRIPGVQAEWRALAAFWNAWRFDVTPNRLPERSVLCSPVLFRRCLRVRNFCARKRSESLATHVLVAQHLSSLCPKSGKLGCQQELGRLSCGFGSRLKLHSQYS